MLAENLSEIWQDLGNPKIFVLTNGTDSKCFYNLTVLPTEIRDSLSTKPQLSATGGCPSLRRELGIFANMPELSYFTIHSEEELSAIKEKIRLYKIRQNTGVEILLD
jgi:hypothetical protein